MYFVSFPSTSVNKWRLHTTHIFINSKFLVINMYLKAHLSIYILSEEIALRHVYQFMYRFYMREKFSKTLYKI